MMKGFVLVLATLITVALGFWGYAETDRTRAALRDVQALNDQIAAAHVRLRMLNAEWAYLNRPDRLADLAAANFDRLGLLPMRPESFGQIEQVLTRPEPIAPLDGDLIDPTDVIFDNPTGVEPL
jgi:hypothetical protein